MKDRRKGDRRDKDQVAVPGGGVKGVADMMNLLDADHRKRLMDSVAERNAPLAEQIKSAMFTFEHLAALDGPDLQKLLREIPVGKLALAMRKASEDTKATIYKNLSQRAGETLREEIQGQGPQRVTDIEAAQTTILELAVKLGYGKKE